MSIEAAGAVVERSPADLREVGNYVVAPEYGLRRLETLPVSLRLVRELYERLMRGVRGDIATPWEFRRSQNWIGLPGCTLEDATYVPPPPTELMPCLDAWERSLYDAHCLLWSMSHLSTPSSRPSIRFLMAMDGLGAC